MSELEGKQRALKVITDKIAQLQASFQAANDEKVSLANQVGSIPRSVDYPSLCSLRSPAPPPPVFRLAPCFLSFSYLPLSLRRSSLYPSCFLSLASALVLTFFYKPWRIFSQTFTNKVLRLYIMFRLKQMDVVSWLLAGQQSCFDYVCAP